MKKKTDNKIQEKKKPGRPSLYSEELAEKICERIATSSHGLNRICQDDNMPSVRSVHQWLQENAEFSQRYARAREAQADLLADEIIDIADDGSRDEMPHPLIEGATTTDHDHINRSRLRVDARKWKASKLAPKKYGDKLAIDLDVQAQRKDIADLFGPAEEEIGK